MKYSLQVVTRNGLVFNDTISINYANLTFYTQGNKFYSIEDATMYNVHILHAGVTPDITHVKLSHCGRVLFERGNETMERHYKLEVSSVDRNKDKNDTYKVLVNKFVAASEIYELMCQFRNTFETLCYKVCIAKTQECGLFAYKEYTKKHTRSFAFTITAI